MPGAASNFALPILRPAAPSACILNHLHQVEVEDLPRYCISHSFDPPGSPGRWGSLPSCFFAARIYEVFEFQLRLAAELNRPVVIHCREAMDVPPGRDAQRDLRGVSLFLPAIELKHGKCSMPVTGWGFTWGRSIIKSDSGREVFVNRRPAIGLWWKPMRRQPATPRAHAQEQKTNEPALVIYTAEMIGRVKGFRWNKSMR